MKTKLIKVILLTAVTFALSCSSEPTNDSQNEENSLSQTIVFIPKSTNFTNKLVTNYVNNQKVSEINYNGSETITQTREFIYGTGTLTVSTFDPQHQFIGKTVYNYDSSNRLTTIEFYNNLNELTITRQNVYEGSDIKVFSLENSVSTLIYLYKTNSSNLIYYEKNILYDIEQNLIYSSNIPTQLLANSGLQMEYEYFLTSMPMTIQNDSIEINNSALASLSIQQIKESCNYYLKKINYPGHYVKYEKEFNADYYIIHDLRTSVTSTDEQINSEIFYYYN